MAFFQSFLDGISIFQMSEGQFVMIAIALLLAYLAIVRKYEPLLLLPIAFGMMIANVPIAGLSAYDEGGLMWFLYQGIARGIYPPLIFLCLGAMTDFGPLIASPRTAIVGLGGQVGIFAAFGLSLLLGFDAMEAASIGIIGSSDGPTAILTSATLAPDLLPVIAIAAYSYMALVPIIQPPIMRILTTKKERVIIMPEPKRVTKVQKIMFPFVVTLVVLLFVPAAGTLISMMMLGNLIKESGVTERYVRTLQNDALNILTLVIGVSIGATATAERMLQLDTILIICLGLLAFGFGTVGGVLLAKFLCYLTGGKVNPLIGNAGVSAMPMAARVSQKLGQEYNPQNHLLMHAMGAIVASTIGSAIIAGMFIAMYGG